MLALATLRDRWPSFIASFVALTLGVAVLTATLLVYASARPAAPPRLAAADVAVRGPHANVEDNLRPIVPWPAAQADDLAARQAALPGVTAAVPDRSLYAQVVLDGVIQDDPPATDPSGHAWSTTVLGGYRVVDGVPPQGPGQVALAETYDVRPGTPVTLLTAAGPVTWTVTATVDGPGIYVADRVASGLAGGVGTIGLVLEPGADAATIARAATGVVGSAGVVLVGARLAELEPEAHVRTRWIGVQIITVMAMLATFSAVFVMASTAGLGAYQRRREIALLRAVGATPGQVRRLMLGEALGVGTLAAIAGAALGTTLAPIVGDLLVRAELEPPGFSTRLTLPPLGIGILTGVVVAVIGTWAASRRAARVSPQDALRHAASDPPPASRIRLVTGGLGILAGLGLAALTPTIDPDLAISTALLSAMALIVGLALLAPVLLPPLIRLALAPRLVREAPIAVLVRESAVNAVRRTAATVAPVLLTVGFTVLVLGFVATASPVFGGGGARATGAEVVVAPDGTPGLSDAAVAALPGRVLSGLSTRVFVSGTPGQPVAVDAIGADAVALAHLGVDLDPLGDRPTVAVSEAASAEYGWSTGAVLRLTFADGTPASVRVAAILPDADLPSPVVLPRAMVRTHDPSALTPVAYVVGADLSTVDAAVAGSATGAKAVAPASYGEDEEDRLVWLLALIMVVLAVGYTGIAVANTVVLAAGDRRPDVAVLRLTGLTGGQVLRALIGETVLGVGLGTAVGFAVALPALVGIRAALQEVSGGSVALLLAWPQTVGVVAACLAFAVFAAVAATRPALHGPAQRTV
jgi:putative ABC transport system permease protein